MKTKITEDGEIICEDCDETIVGRVPPFFKTPYNHDTDAEAHRTATVNTQKSLTDQSFTEEADINTIMERYGKGLVPSVPLPEHFGDAFQIPTLLEARTRIAESNATFYNLPPKIREEFMGDPARWEQQVIKDINEGNIDDLERMGLDMKEVRHRIDTYEQDLVKAEDEQAEKQLSDLQERLARRARTAQGGSPAPGNPGEAGAAPKPPPTSKN